MTAPEPGLPAIPAQTEEWGATLALLPVAATLGFYILPASLQEQTLILFAPQIIAYLALALWAAYNRDILSRLGLENRNIRDGLRWGQLRERWVFGEPDDHLAGGAVVPGVVGDGGEIDGLGFVL